VTLDGDLAVAHPCLPNTIAATVTTQCTPGHVDPPCRHTVGSDRRVVGRVGVYCVVSDAHCGVCLFASFMCSFSLGMLREKIILNFFGAL